MLKNYVVIAFRNLVRHKLNSFLNISGLAIGITCCLLILMYVNDEMSYDKFHDNADRIYRIENFLTTTERTMYMAVTSQVHGEMLMIDYPEVENYVRITGYSNERNIRYGDKSFEEDFFLFADSTFFKIFSFELVKGNPEEALMNPYSVVISESAAEKYFGEDDPVGKNLISNYTSEYTITGVMKDIPSNSHIRPDFVASLSTYGLEPTGNAMNDLLSNMNYYTYLLLRPGSDHLELEKKQDTFWDKYCGPLFQQLNASAKTVFKPLGSIYLGTGPKTDQEIGNRGDMAYVYLFSGIGFFILLLACLNFMNLSTARSANRAREVGMRKVVGAKRGQLIKQFIGESTLLGLLGGLIALLFVYLTIPFFNTISGKMLSFSSLFNPVLIAGMTGFILFIGLIGGSYPALFLSAFRPVEVLRGTLSKGSKSSILRILLVAIQFTVSIVLIIGTLVINDQLNYMRDKNLGYDRDHVGYINIRNNETAGNSETIRQEVLKHPNVISASTSASVPYSYNNSGVHHPVGKPEEELVMCYGQIVDDNYINTYKMDLIQGRNFSRDRSTDNQYAAIINETLANRVGWFDNAVGQEIEMYTSVSTKQKYEIIGVIKDFNFQSLHEEIQPMILYYSIPFDFTFDVVSIRMRPENIRETIAFLEETWKKFDTEYPFEFEFINDYYNRQYRTEERLGDLFGYFTFLAIVIGCLGLFGLASFTAEQRTKEIGIRKVLGASVSGIIMMLVREFTKWVLVAVLIAWPLGYYVMDLWLQNFAYRTGIGITVLVLSAFLAFVIAVVTVSYQATKAALGNPVKALKYE